MFHFFGFRDDYQRIKEGVARLAERGHLNASSANSTVRQEPTLLIEVPAPPGGDAFRSPIERRSSHAGT